MRSVFPAPPYGKRLPTMEEHASILMPLAASDNETINKFGAVTSGTDYEFIAVQVSDRAFRFAPGPEFSPRLYRGQHTQYATCRPSLFRKLDSRRAQQQYARLLFWLMKEMELTRIISGHPAVQEMLHYWQIDNLHYEISSLAIAQHYGLPTQCLDLTRSRDVALFFATHYLEGARWLPAIGHKAVLYSADYAGLIKKGVRPLGIDPFSRPFAQRAFLLAMAPNDDFVQMPEVQAETFTVTDALAKQASEAVGGSAGLLPPDPFIDEVERVKNNRFVHRETIQMALNAERLPEGMTVVMAEQQLRRAGYQITNDPCALPARDVWHAVYQAWQRLRLEYLRRVRFRYFSDHLQQ